MSDITIKVLGQAGAGKTTISHIIQQALEAYGIKSQVYESHYDNEDITPEFISKRANILKLKNSIRIEAIQLVRDSFVL